ncbi:hypothetical protein E2C01_005400 [Portunus trituberculatus]|uniref:Uncharacterized protein n=1 Tax=Portunus trituberculatus TaxID=210409 RepID=A0A5B7CWJ9_PORTR|nr:hypothetical protein [Portunus trituberculatus]
MRHAVQSKETQTLATMRIPNSVNFLTFILHHNSLIILRLNLALGAISTSVYSEAAYHGVKGKHMRADSGQERHRHKRRIIKTNEAPPRRLT